MKNLLLYLFIEDRRRRRVVVIVMSWCGVKRKEEGANRRKGGFN